MTAKAGSGLDISGPSPGLDHFPGLGHSLENDPGPENALGLENDPCYDMTLPDVSWPMALWGVCTGETWSGLGPSLGNAFDVEK